MQAAGLREGGNPWLLRLERAGSQYRAVLKTGDPASARDRMQLRTQVAALALAHDRGLPVPRVIAADLAGRQAGMLAMMTSVLPGSSTIPRTMPAGRARSLGAVAAVALTPRPDLPVPSGATVLVHGACGRATRCGPQTCAPVRSTGMPPA